MDQQTSNSTTPTQDLTKLLSDRNWRLRNLYYITDKAGNKVLFKPNKEQEVLMNEMWWFNIIPKARQLGITTFWAIYYLDAVLFSANKQAGIIAHTKDAAKKIFKNKIKYAYDNLPDWLKDNLGSPSMDTAQEITFANGSSISVSTSVRSGTYQYLHISEFGKICAKYPEKAKEIVTGSINTVQAGQGMISIESTAEGQDGYFYEFVMEALRLQLQGTPLSPLQFKLFFFPWYDHPEYQLSNPNIIITEEEEDYFKALEAEQSISLSDPQKRWYVVKRRTNKAEMLREYPSTLDEAFQANVEGAYYQKEMTSVFEDGRITKVPYNAKEEVDTWWDLGVNDFNVIIFTQRGSKGSINIIDLYYNHSEGLQHYVNKLHEKGYRYGYHHLPHDVEVRDLTTGLSRRQALHDMGMYNIRVAPKPQSKNDAIEKVRQLFSRFYFDAKKVERLVKALQMFRREWDEKRGTFKDRPFHDSNSHFADALQTLGILWRDGYYYDDTNEEDRNTARRSRSEASETASSSTLNV